MYMWQFASWARLVPTLCRAPGLRTRLSALVPGEGRAQGYLNLVPGRGRAQGLLLQR